MAHAACAALAHGNSPDGVIFTQVFSWILNM